MYLRVPPNSTGKPRVAPTESKHWRHQTPRLGLWVTAGIALSAASESRASDAVQRNESCLIGCAEHAWLKVPQHPPELWLAVLATDSGAIQQVAPALPCSPNPIALPAPHELGHRLD
jgi:hypothetical protein